ncbi:hypothetical protein [Methylorubrum extorquens]|uniref:hypothetical protein n=1 Tax=Methylorubrum extorquens TaxID=408 RepID=UPI0020A132FA|nr:hypothetical protein [Methylorubrum extorquens]MCP1539968.1 hypothetical protein [Methylorubrum extorquens]
MRQALLPLLLGAPVPHPPLDDAAITAAVITAATRTTVACLGMEVNYRVEREAIRVLGVTQAEIVRPEVQAAVFELTKRMMRHKPESCTRIWEAFGPDGRVVPGLVYANPAIR